MPTPPVNDYPWQGAFPDTPNWSENFLLAGDDPKAGVGFWLHLGRWRKDLRMFRETTIVRLPDGTTVGNRAIGNGRAARDGPGGRIGAPADAPGATEAERITTYAGALARTVEDAFPTRYFAHRLDEDAAFPGRDDWRAFRGQPADGCPAIGRIAAVL